LKRAVTFEAIQLLAGRQLFGPFKVTTAKLLDSSGQAEKGGETTTSLEPRNSPLPLSSLSINGDAEDTLVASQIAVGEKKRSLWA